MLTDAVILKNRGMGTRERHEYRIILYRVAGECLPVRLDVNRDLNKVRSKHIRERAFKASETLKSSINAILPQGDL